MRITIPDILKKKAEGKQITMLTAYDFPFAQIVDEAGIDIVLIGDSLSMVVQGNDTTTPVTMDEMVYHTRLVSKAAKNALVVGDMPFMSYHISIEEAVYNAGRFLKEGGAQAVKLEGGIPVSDTIKAITKAEIPVMAHIGLTPQSVHKFGGYKVQGKDPKVAKRLLADAKAVEEAGAFAIVLEAIPAPLARQITKAVKIPTIGIGAGKYCDGNVLVLYDMLGLFNRFVPKFVKRYANLREEALKAVKQYKEDVEKGRFPAEEHSFK
ncbi:MAG: 3-methyl-2-oxobutanoate hydroxymethyltransferase [Nitrospirae bacterium]|nr:3-methyl-2-oxobutanoate hydroxymethyltransferase [Nitrospirota bacterium]